MAVPTFVDRVTLNVVAGNGGNGIASVHREKFKPLGGPDGGNGGHGGDVVLRVSADVTTLVDYHHEPKRKAGNGAPGEGGHRSGGHGDEPRRRADVTISCRLRPKRKQKIGTKRDSTSRSRAVAPTLGRQSPASRP